MKKPYTICHILSALDGKITGAFMGTKSVQEVSGEYGRIRSEYQADAWLYGTVTTKEFTQGRKPELDPTADVPDGDFVAENDAAYLIFWQAQTGWTARLPLRSCTGCLESIRC